MIHNVKNMKQFSQYINKLTTPTTFTSQDGIAYWQEAILLKLLFASVVVGAIAYVPSVALCIKEKYWAIVLADTALYFFVLFLFCKRDLPFLFRATCYPLIIYIIGLAVVATLGPYGDGPVWLFCFPVISGMLMGHKMAIWALIINALTYFGIGLSIHFNLISQIELLNYDVWHLATGNDLQRWIVYSLNFMLLNIIATLSVTSILGGLQTSLFSLAVSENKHRRIFENILDVYFESDENGILQEISPSVENLLHYPRHEFIGKPHGRFFQDMTQASQSLAQLTRHGQLTDHEICLTDKNGDIHHCSLNARLLTHASGRPDRIVGIFRDISNQKMMEKEKHALEERLTRAQKMEALGLLAGGVAHDLNNVLSGIVTYPEVLAMNLKQNDPLKKSLRTIQSAGERAAEIVQDLLTLARRNVVTHETLNLNDLVSDFLLTPECRNVIALHPDILVEKQIHAVIPFLKGSRIHLQKTLLNLITNAAEAQPDGGMIRICTENRHLDRPIKGYDHVHTGDYIVLSVADAGAGIRDEDLKRIFEPFFTKKEMGRSGTGLGMAVVWGTVQDHEGYIDITSSADSGTVFDLYFPISADQIIAQPTPLPLETYKGAGEIVLVVDDVAEQRRIAANALETLGYHAVCISSGEAAIAYLKTDHADLLLLDMMMEPGIDGLETYRRILDFKPAQKAIIASGFSKTRQADGALKLGAGCYLNKPYTMATLGAAIKAELEKSS